MSTDLDDRLLRRRLEALAEGPLASLDEVEGDVGRRIERRRRRRPLGAAAAVAAAALVVVGAVLLLPDGGPDIVASGDGDERPPAAATVGIASIRSSATAAGTSRLVVTFGGSAPAGRPGFVAGYLPGGSSPDGVVVTAQPRSRVWVCDDWHSFPSGRGSVDVLVPAAWLPPSFDLADVEGTPVDPDGLAGPKVVWCGPHDGFVQISLWGPAATDPDEITVAFTPDRRRLVVDLGPT